MFDQVQQDKANKQHISELEYEIVFYKEKQQELMAYTQSLTENNVASKSIVSELHSKVFFPFFSPILFYLTYSAFTGLF